MRLYDYIREEVSRQGHDVTQAEGQLRIAGCGAPGNGRGSKRITIHYQDLVISSTWEHLSNPNKISSAFVMSRFVSARGSAHRQQT